MSQFSGRQLHSLRKLQGRSREQVAVAAGISVSTVIRYEQERAVPSLNAAAAIAAALGTDVANLLVDTGQPAAEPRNISELPAWAQRLIHDLRADVPAGNGRSHAVSAA